MAILVERHINSLTNYDPDCVIEGEYAEIAIDDIDIMSLPSPQSRQQQLDSIEARQRVLMQMSVDTVYDEETRAKIKVRSKIPIKNDYVAPLERLLRSRGIDITKPYRAMYFPATREYKFYQTKP